MSPRTPLVPDAACIAEAMGLSSPPVEAVAPPPPWKPPPRATDPRRYIDEPNDAPDGCTCFIAPPCSYCMGACIECRTYIGEGLCNEDGLCEICVGGPDDG